MQMLYLGPKKCSVIKEAAKRGMDWKEGIQVLKSPHTTAYTKPQHSLATALVYILVCHIKNKSGHLFLTRA